MQIMDFWGPSNCLSFPWDIFIVALRHFEDFPPLSFTYTTTRLSDETIENLLIINI